MKMVRIVEKKRCLRKKLIAVVLPFWAFCCKRNCVRTGCILHAAHIGYSYTHLTKQVKRGLQFIP